MDNISHYMVDYNKALFVLHYLGTYLVIFVVAVLLLTISVIGNAWTMSRIMNPMMTSSNICFVKSFIFSRNTLLDITMYLWSE